MILKQIMSKPKKSEVTSPKTQPIKRGRGRPKGSKNKNHRDVELNPEMLQVQGMLKQLLKLIGDTIKPSYFVYDGAFGNNAAVQMTRQVDLHLISKLRHDAALYYKWTGVYSGKGRPRTYGDKINYQQLSQSQLKSTEIEEGIETCIYQMYIPPLGYTWWEK